MQLMTFNSLLMFDIVFIFFLFLVGVTCLVYYLPPRELTPHDQSSSFCSSSSSSSSSSSTSSSPVAFPSPRSGGPVVRGCASAARRISGEGGTPIILVGVRNEAEQQQQQQQQHSQQETVQDRSPGRRFSRALTADSVRTDPVDLYPSYPGGRMVADEQEVLLLDCTLEELVALRQMAAGGEMRLSRAEPCRSCCCQYQPSVDRWVGPTVAPIVPLPPTPPPPPPRCTVPFAQGGEDEAEDEEEDEEEYIDEVDQQQQQQHHRVEYVRIEIERRGPTTNNGNTNATTTTAIPAVSMATSGGGAAGGEPTSMPACCYVRAKDTDIRACSGPIHDV
ncbi:AGAP013276-PA [Anopheles gambiae str. PEST]|uniref:AGAP013276-PA n=1 Tax=Anopheles gambiae TaxID=7165 RepID=F5HJX3_ANOGA|nr:AGAP013276-PA [Anopheles gambiae str. PEST]